MKTIADLRASLSAYVAVDGEESAMRDKMILFLDSHVDCLWRTELSGHFTASAWVVDATQQNVLLIDHRKLSKWLQPGGHSDGDPDLLSVAQREVLEETGLNTKALTSDIFDLDVHSIPARGNEPMHLHYDVRFLLTPENGAVLQINSEVRSARWVPLQEVHLVNSERSILRMVDKFFARKG